VISAITYLERLVLGILVLALAFPIVFSFAQESIRMETTSEQGTFLIEVDWIPGDIGSDNIFSIRFIEPETGLELEDIQYDLVVTKEGGEQTLRRVDQVSLEQRIRFAHPGPYTVAIEDIEGLGEDASLSFEVTPEFPLSVVVPLSVAAFIAILALQRGNNSLFSQWTKKH
jgi:hypothetical protein